ncbi:MAG: metal ABC transporter permease, partial [Thiobacillus sp.]|nr:metal ABC transporter permease [Thiobacillus sp.]
ARAVGARGGPQSPYPLSGPPFGGAARGGGGLRAGDPHGGEHLAELLTGQILWATSAQAMQMAVLYSILLAFMAWRGERLGGRGFYLVFALAITASVQVVGVYLVFASLILPALAVRGLPARPGLQVGWTVGALAYAAGLAVSALLDTPSGPAIVIALAVIALLAGRTLRVAASGGQR